MMAEQRFEALAGAEVGALEALADDILGCGLEVSVTAGPESVSAPIRVAVPGSGATTVVLGHVSLTRCTITLAGTRGDGMRSGYDLVGAVAAAVCDAEYERRGPLAGRVRELCRAAEQARAREDGERAGLVAMTRLGEP
jgi:alpha-D-ribose 1-methylphosphonate 5-triphosphate synthase subunit PhnG